MKVGEFLKFLEKYLYVIWNLNLNEKNKKQEIQMKIKNTHDKILKVW